MLTAWRSARRDCDSAQARLLAARDDRRAAVAAAQRRFRESFGSSGALIWSFNAGLLAGLKPRRPAPPGETNGSAGRSFLKSLLKSLPLLVSIAGHSPGAVAAGPERGTDHASSEPGAPEAPMTTAPPVSQEDAT